MFERLTSGIDPTPLITRRALQRGGFARLPVPGSREFWVVSDPKLLRTVLHADSHKYDKGGPLYGAIRQALGQDGLFTVNDDRLRTALLRVLSPTFGIEAQPKIAHVVSQVLADRMPLWGETSLDMFQEFKWLTTAALFRHLLGEEPADSDRMVRLANPVFEGMATRVFLPRWLPGAQAYHTAIARLDQALYAVIERRKAQPYGDDMLSALLAAQSERQLFTDVQIRDQVFTMLMAGFDSTAVAMAWASLYLAENPIMRAKLRHEVQQVLQGRNALCYGDLAKLHMLQSFFQSVLHWHPSFPMYFRNVRQQTVLGNRVLREGTQLLIAPHAAHRDKRYWPERTVSIGQFMGRLTDDRRYTHLPFGRGPRRCIGEQMATTTFMVVIGNMLNDFSSWDRPQRNAGHKAAYAMTRPPVDCRLTLQ